MIMLLITNAYVAARIAIGMTTNAIDVFGNASVMTTNVMDATTNAFVSAARPIVFVGIAFLMMPNGIVIA